MILTLDIGNSKTKYGFFTDRSLIESGTVETAEALVLLSKAKNPGALVISSVDPEMERSMTEAIAKTALQTLILRSTDDFGFRNNYKTPKTLGVDRLCGIAGALEYIEISNDINLSRERFIVTVDCGTATTINILDGNTFTGGIIMPGMMTMAKSLNVNTAQLPEVVPAGEVPLIGASTIECIKSGIVNATAGLIERIITELNLTAHGFSLFLTGGNTNYLAKALKFNFIENANLVLYGINRMARTKGVLND